MIDELSEWYGWYGWLGGWVRGWGDDGRWKMQGGEGNDDR